MDGKQWLTTLLGKKRRRRRNLEEKENNLQIRIIVEAKHCSSFIYLFNSIIFSPNRKKRDRPKKKKKTKK